MAATAGEDATNVTTQPRPLPEMIADADRLREAGDIPQALAAWAAVRAAYPLDGIGFIRPAELLIDIGSADEAEPLLTEAVGRFPLDPWMARAHARAAQQSGDPETALRRFQHVRQAFPAFSIARSDLVLYLLFTVRDQAQATLEGAAAVEAFPNDLWVWDSYACCAEEMRDHAAAAERWERARQLEPRHKRAWLGLIRSLQHRERFDEADTLCQEALARFPEDPPLLQLQEHGAWLRHNWVDAAPRLDIAGAAERWTLALAPLQGETRPIVLVHGNDQAREVASILGRVTALDGFRFHHVPPMPAGFSGQTIAGVVAAWVQVSPGGPDTSALANALPAACVQARFPVLRLEALWPRLQADPRNVPEHVYPLGRYPWSDCYAAELAELAELSDVVLVERYVEATSAVLPDLAALLAADLAAMDMAGAVPMVDFIRDGLRLRPLFHAPDVANGELIVELAARLLRTLPGLDGAAGEAALRRLTTGYVGNLMKQVPIHPTVADRLGLTWYRHDARYRTGQTVWSFDRFTADRIRWRKWLP